MNTNTNETILDMNAMMNETLDQVEDLAGFVTPPAGEYSLTVMSAAPGKPSKDGTATIQIIYSIAETLSVAGGEQPVPNESMFSERFQWTENGKKYLKARVKDIMNTDSVDGVSLGDMLASLKGAPVKARISIKKTPKNDGSGDHWENIEIRVVKS